MRFHLVETFHPEFPCQELFNRKVRRGLRQAQANADLPAGRQGAAELTCLDIILCSPKYFSLRDSAVNGFRLLIRFRISAIISRNWKIRNL